MSLPADPISRILAAVAAGTLAILLVSALVTGSRPGGGDAGIRVAGGHPEPMDVHRGADAADTPEEGAPPIAPEAEALPDPEEAAVAPLVDPERTSIAWTTGGLREGFADRIQDLPSVERMALVRGGLLELVRSTDADGRVIDAPSNRFVLPLDAIAVNTDTYPAFYEGAVALAALDRGQAILSETSAVVRRLGVGGILEMSDGERLEVVAVLPDELVGGAEIVVDLPTGRAIGVDRERFVLVVHEGTTEELAGEIVRAVASVEDRPIRVLPAAGERVLRHGLGILTQAETKAAFGEFSYRNDDPDRAIAQDPAWREANIVRERVPILGVIRCHRALIPRVRAVMEEVVARGLESTIDPRGYAGCWNARLTNRLDAVSRHSWGVGIDLNFPDNLVGTPGTMDPRLIEIFADHGFAWGGDWLLTDPAHFELVEP
jgi:hypothetical protein